MMNPAMMMKQMAALYKLMGNYLPAIYAAVNADKEGLSIKIAAP